MANQTASGKTVKSIRVANDYLGVAMTRHIASIVSMAKYASPAVCADFMLMRVYLNDRGGGVLVDHE